MILKTTPDDFKPIIHVVGCVIVFEDKHLLLKRNSDKFEGGTWQAPGGKIEKGESREIALKREIFEETGLSVDIDNFIYMNSYNVRYSEYDFVYEIFLYKLNERPKIVLRENEHSDFAWVSKEEARLLPIIKDGHAVLDDIYSKF